MANSDKGKVTQSGRSFQHTCFLYSPLVKSDKNPQFLLFLPKVGNLIGGTLGDISPGRQIHKQLLSTKNMSSMEFQSLLERAQRDVRRGQSNNLSANEYAIQLLKAFDVQSEGGQHDRHREMSEVYVVTYVNDLPDRIEVEQPEPGSGCVMI
jgi:hypothetical protein